MEYRGIDVSDDNGVINWLEVKRSKKVQFAILRIHQRYGAEKYFPRNYRKCTKRKIPVGAYKYSYALTEYDAKKEAKAVLKAAKGKTFQYPIFYDLEWDDMMYTHPIPQDALNVNPELGQNEGWQWI